MTISAADSPPTVGAARVRLKGDSLTVELTDARQVTVDISRVDWLAWLRDWPDLDDGIGVAHLLTAAPVG